MRVDDVRITKPCDLDWRTLKPADRGRFCDECKKVVRDLSSMTEEEAADTLRNAGGGELCVRYLYDKNGKILFAQNRPGALVAASLLHRAKRTAVTAAAAAMPLVVTACASPFDSVGQGKSFLSAVDDDRHDDVNENMGGVSSDMTTVVSEPGDAATADSASGDIDAGPAEDGG